MSAINKQIERKGANTEPLVHFYPEVRGGTCEYCGIMDKNAEAVDQYKLCQHYRGKQLRCSYCPPSINPDEVIRRSVLKIMDSPDNANELIVLCDSFQCSDAHLRRFRKSGA
jgi:alkyl hydroperoxide reductase subunit AhpC